MTQQNMAQWIGRTEALVDQVSLVSLQALAATLDCPGVLPQTGAQVPPCWHWLYFLPIPPMAGIGPDGHPLRGGFLPPVDLPRRMWAGSRLVFHHPLRAGSHVRRVSRIAEVTRKLGRTGDLVFVQVQHETSDEQGLAITELQDIVYRGMPAPGAVPLTTAARTDEQFSRRIVPDPVLLFRYSALTFNGHRIHYDRPYAMLEEGYPGLVVHGPLIATLLLEQLRHVYSNMAVVAFEFKAVSPLFDTGAFEVCGRLDGNVASLWARGPEGQLAMQARATLASDSSVSNTDAT